MKLERPVALKFLAANAVEDPEHKVRFVREAEAAARLDHQNICSAYEIDERGSPWAPYPLEMVSDRVPVKEGAGGETFVIKVLLLVGMVLSGVLVSAGQTIQEPRNFFEEQIGLSDDQIARIDVGKVVVKMLPSKTPAEVFIFGAAHVNAAPEDYLKFAFDTSRLRSLPGYLGVRRFSNPPTLSDLEGFTLEPDDIKNLKSCRPGKCDVQLSPKAMLQLQKAVNWSAPDVAEQVNERVRKMALEILVRYQERGNSALDIYQDKSRAFNMAAELRSLLSRSEVLPAYLPELKRCLLEYPAAMLPNVESFFYWEKVDFGLKPTLRLNHVIAYRSTGPRGAAHVVAVKQLWASHYFQLALDLTACVPESGRTHGAGFYVISLKGSTQQGLTGFMGFFRRRVVVSKTLSAQEEGLINIKKALEERE